MHRFVYLLLLLYPVFVQASKDHLKVDDLAVLCIDQANYHRKNSPLESPFSRKVQKIYGRNTLVEGFYKPGDFPDQIQIYTTTFVPSLLFTEFALVHTHGGPASHMKKDTYHAETCYYLDNGLPIYAVNYRGSTGFDKAFKNIAKGRNVTYGVQDVFSVCKVLQEKGKKLILRGGSFGSCINTHLLQSHLNQIDICAVHLAGGIKYPTGTDMPREVPILIAHGVNDDIVPFELGARFALQMLYAGYTNVQFIGAEYGDHHMISPLLTEAIDCCELTELKDYLSRSTGFIHSVVNGSLPKIDPVLDQIESIETLIERANKRYHTEPETIKRKIALKQKLLAIMADFNPLLMIEPTIYVDTHSCFGPTMNHLKLVLGDRFTPNVRDMLELFLCKEFTPVEWPSQTEFNREFGPEMVKDVTFIDQCTSAILAEEEFLKLHPDHMVVYHTASQDSMRLYILNTICRTLLQGCTATELSCFRIFDNMGESFYNVDDFLVQMRLQYAKEREDTVFNNVKGFAPRAIAGVPFLTASRFNTAACSLFWHYRSTAATKSPYVKVIKQLFKIMGIYSRERVKRYEELFALDQDELNAANLNQGVLQQIFIPVSYADEYGYNCQMWGRELEKNSEGLEKPSIIKGLQSDPVAFEEKLRRNKSAFSNPEEIEYRSNQLPYFTDLLQLRLIVRAGGITKVRSYVRQQEQFDRFVATMQKEMLWDFADFILSRNSIPKVLIPNANDFSKSLRERIGISQDADEYTLYIRHRMFKALLSPNKTVHGICSNVGLRLNDIADVLVGASTYEINYTQNALIQGGGDEMLKHRPTYAPCYYLKGYTYYSLLMEAIEDRYVHNPEPKSIPYYNHLHEGMLKGAIKMFADPRSSEDKFINPDRYEQLKTLALRLTSYKLDLRKHAFFQRSNQGRLHEDTMWSQELSNAVWSFLLHAEKARNTKNKSNNFKAIKDKSGDFYYAVIKPLEDKYEDLKDKF